MKSVLLWSLVGLNALLLVTFLGRFTHDNAAVAQNVAPRRGDYIMIPGEVTGGNSGVVYVIDTTNELLSGITYDENAKRLTNMQKIDLQAIFSKSAAAQNEPGNNRRR